MRKEGLPEHYLGSLQARSLLRVLYFRDDTCYPRPWDLLMTMQTSRVGNLWKATNGTGLTGQISFDLKNRPIARFQNSFVLVIFLPMVMFPANSKKPWFLKLQQICLPSSKVSVLRARRIRLQMSILRFSTPFFCFTLRSSSVLNPSRLKRVDNDP